MNSPQIEILYLNIFMLSNVVSSEDYYIRNRKLSNSPKSKNLNYNSNKLNSPQIIITWFIGNLFCLNSKYIEIFEKSKMWLKIKQIEFAAYQNYMFEYGLWIFRLIDLSGTYFIWNLNLSNSPKVIFSS